MVADWVIAGRFAAFAPTVDYHYWPLSKLRILTLVVLSGSLGLDVYERFRSDWMLLVSVLAIVVYAAALMADLESQRSRNDDDPLNLPRYSEPDVD